jgi:serine protease
MKKITLILFTSLLIFRCSDPGEIKDPLVQKQNPRLIPKKQIDEFIISALHTHNKFEWSMASDEIIWSAAMQSDSIVTIGYKPALEKEISARMATINVHSEPWREARQVVLDEILTMTNTMSKSKIKNIAAYVHDVLPYVEIKVTEIEVITRLRSLETVRYVEPLSYTVQKQQSNGANERTESDSGCSNDPDFNIPELDFITTTPNAKIAWNYPYMQIEQAWNFSTGRGITVGLIDTGISPNQSKLGGEFNSGESSGRYIEKYGTFVSSWWPWASVDGPNDQCGHGTAMAGVIASPRSTSGSSVGVAYNCNLIVYRASGDVIINGGKEKTGVANAMIALANRSDVRVISMSLGDIISNSNVADAVRYAYGKDKLIFCAAGTSTNFTNWFGVIFPASMSETVAVTGIKAGSYTKCDVCHSGSKVDFTIVMERSGNSKHPITLTMSGSQPSTVGGSSVATATAAGIAALVWARNPAWTRSQVLEKLKQSAGLYPTRDSEYGWGTLNALAAVQ